MLPQEIIRKKRNGQALHEKEISFIISGITDGTFSENQLAAFAMAVYFQGMSLDECTILTECMMRSGRVLDWSEIDLNRPVGHTGGTLDKLESIPGYNTHPDNALFLRTVKDVGCAVIGQTADLAPADKIFYSVRDVTATIESVPLITASILSKKLAAGLDGLVVDVKTGNGAFADQLDMAEKIANSIFDVSNHFGVKTSALITDMNQPLGRTVGNALEVRETVDYLTGADQDPRLHEVVISLAAEMLAVAGLTETIEQGVEKANEVSASGRGAEKFNRMVSALGGPADFIENYNQYLPQAPIVKPVPALKTGYITSIDTRSVGLTVVELGGGRKKVTDSIDHSVGLDIHVALGENVKAGQPLAEIHARTEEQLNAAIQTIQNAYIISESPPDPAVTIIDRINYK